MSYLGPHLDWNFPPALIMPMTLSFSSGAHSPPLSQRFPPDLPPPPRTRSEDMVKLLSLLFLVVPARILSNSSFFLFFPSFYVCVGRDSPSCPHSLPPKPLRYKANPVCMALTVLSPPPAPTTIGIGRAPSPGDYSPPSAHIGLERRITGNIQDRRPSWHLFLKLRRKDPVCHLFMQNFCLPTRGFHRRECTHEAFFMGAVRPPAHPSGGPRFLPPCALTISG